MKSIYTVAKNCYIETIADSEFTCVASGYAQFDLLIDGKTIRRKLIDKKVYNECRYAVRYKNELLLLPFNISNRMKKDEK